MSVWGKLGGGGIGLTIGGPIGALAGAFAGHYLVDRPGAPFGPQPRDLILTTGLIALLAKMARADGVVLRSEVDAFEAVVVVPPEEDENVRRLFRLAQETTAGFEAYARQLAAAFADEPALLDDIVEGLFLVARADGAIHEAELDFIGAVAAIFGRDEAWFDAVVERHVHRRDDPYLELGARRCWSDAELKAHHRRLVARHHPDREIARGLPPEAIRIATSRLATINVAWERIARERGMRP
ncbi:TerB family tellurite resistance protein [Enterovirga sp.]|uniref:TerB family tellurite resistance protein n=1 Tax=Enterovirga sp. TaxID=2026350 RepID=UPI002CBC99B7|nr:TerB family tellurite resistance protein [Enterovirga sp.]HMO27780.1 TerB family tellurite resistance protein [Enterovirga sp.]